LVFLLSNELSGIGFKRESGSVLGETLKVDGGLLGWAASEPEVAGPAGAEGFTIVPLLGPNIVPGVGETIWPGAKPGDKLGTPLPGAPSGAMGAGT